MKLNIQQMTVLLEKNIDNLVQIDYCVIVIM